MFQHFDGDSTLTYNNNKYINITYYEAFEET